MSSSSRALSVFAIGASLVACASPPPQPPVTSSEPTRTEFPPATSAGPIGSAPSATPVASTSATTVTLQTFTVVEGTPHTLPDGTTISAGKMTYAHLTGDRNLSRCVVTVTRGGKSETKTLEREGLITFTVVAGLHIALDGVDPYHQPSSAFLVVGE